MCTPGIHSCVSAIVLLSLAQFPEEGHPTETQCLISWFIGASPTVFKPPFFMAGIVQGEGLLDCFFLEVDLSLREGHPVW